MSALENILKLEIARVASEDKAAERFVYPGTPAFDLIMACVEEGFKATLESTNIFKLELAKQAAAERATMRYIQPGTPAFDLIMLCVEEGLKDAFEEEKVA